MYHRVWSSRHTQRAIAGGGKRTVAIKQLLKEKGRRRSYVGVGAVILSLTKGPLLNTHLSFLLESHVKNISSRLKYFVTPVLTVHWLSLEWWLSRECSGVLVVCVIRKMYYKDNRTHLSIVSFDSHHVRRFRFQPKELFKFGKYLDTLNTCVVSCSGVLQGVVVNFCRYPPSLITSDCSVHGEDSILDSPFTDWGTGDPPPASCAM